MGTPALWVAFNSGILLLLVLDLGVFNRRAHVISMREAAAWSVFWVTLSLAFNAWLLHAYGSDKALQFFTGYLIEKSLSVDNIFVFILVFRAFDVEPRYQHRILYWGVLGALVLRGAMIALGAALISKFDWVLYIFGAFLVIAAIRMLLRKKKERHPENSPLLRWAQRVFHVSRDYKGPRLWTREAGKFVATPLLLVLLVIEGADLVFALDSIPAVFSITRDPFIVYTSNVCAILGLRALYFLLAGALPYFQYLDEGLSAVLLFVGAKMLVAHWYDIPTGIALGVVAGILGISILISILAADVRKRAGMKKHPAASVLIHRYGRVWMVPELISDLGSTDRIARDSAFVLLSLAGLEHLTKKILSSWMSNQEFSSLLLRYKLLDETPDEDVEADLAPSDFELLKATVGIATSPRNFVRIRKAHGSPILADVPPDQDALEFELHVERDDWPPLRFDILTTKDPDGDGAIAKFLKKFGEGIQQVEYEVSDVDRATQILAEKFNQKAVYPATRPGANGTRINFFLVPTESGKKILIELVEPAR
jgi:tellurite resistance protein TerC